MSSPNCSCQSLREMREKSLGLQAREEMFPIFCMFCLDHKVWTFDSASDSESDSDGDSEGDSDDEIDGISDIDDGSGSDNDIDSESSTQPTSTTFNHGTTCHQRDQPSCRAPAEEGCQVEPMQAGLQNTSSPPPLSHQQHQQRMEHIQRYDAFKRMDQEEDLRRAKHGLIELQKREIYQRMEREAELQRAENKQRMEHSRVEHELEVRERNARIAALRRIRRQERQSTPQVAWPARGFF